MAPKSGRFRAVYSALGNSPLRMGRFREGMAHRYGPWLGWQAIAEHVASFGLKLATAPRNLAVSIELESNTTSTTPFIWARDVIHSRISGTGPGLGGMAMGRFRTRGSMRTKG